MSEDGNVIAVLGLLHKMSGDDYRDPLLCKRRDTAPKFTARERIGAAGRLIEEQDLGFVKQCRRHSKALLMAAREKSALQVLHFSQIELLQRPRYPPTTAIAVQTVGA